MPKLPRLIVSDIDGTLLHGDETALNPRLFALIGALKERGILFAPASGRQYHSLRRLFAPAAGELCFLCENGAAVYGPNESEACAVPLSNTFMDEALARQVCREILAIPALDVLISRNNMSYLISRHRELVDRIANFTGNNYCLVSSPEEVPEGIIKLAAFCPTGIFPYAPALTKRWQRQFTVSIAGDLWLDFTLANKGTGVRALSRSLGIELADVMAFGDNYNNLPMLDVVGQPVIMDNAAPALRARYPMHCRRVEEVLEEICRESARRGAAAGVLP